MSVEQWVAILAEPIKDLAVVLAGEEYDAEAERQALLAFNRKVSDAIAARDLAGP
jgi:hypothetical protein